MAKKIKIKQVRSSIGREQRIKDTLAALGLGRIGYQSEVNLNPSTEGMIKSVGFLVEIVAR
jgi:large subunit ribosomal protein L30